MMTFVPLVLWHWCLHRTLQQGTASRLVLLISRVSCPRNCKQNLAGGWWYTQVGIYYIGLVLSSPRSTNFDARAWSKLTSHGFALLLQARDCDVMACRKNRNASGVAFFQFIGPSKQRVWMKASQGGRWNCLFQSYKGNFKCLKKTQEETFCVLPYTAYRHCSPKRPFSLFTHSLNATRWYGGILFPFNRLFWLFKRPFCPFEHPFCPNNRLNNRWPTVYTV